MVRVLGSSAERVPIPDLKDVVYYRQVKEYTDHEYEASKDLRKAIDKGKLTLLGREEPLRGSIVNEGKTVDIGAEIRAALREVNGHNLNAQQVAREIAPIVAEMVRQEISRISVVSKEVVPATVSSAFVGPEYVPTVTTEGMSASIEARTTETSADSANDALAALRKLRTAP